MRFQDKLSKLRFFDPACGCGNFLIIAYRELRTLEIEVIREVGELELSRVDVDQFCGIEIGEFPVRIAETAMWMMDHIMNNRLSLALGRAYVRIPLQKSPHIVHGDALETEWAEVLPSGSLLVRVRQPAIRRSKVPECGATGAGAGDCRVGEERRNVGLRNRVVHQGGGTT